MALAISYRRLTLRRASLILIAGAALFWLSNKFIESDSRLWTRLGVHIANDPIQVYTPRPPASSNTAEESDTRARHVYRADGLLEVNTDAPHPIFELIERAEAEWEEKLRRASKTLDEVVEEYKRRYHLPPPAGFDRWWEYVKKYNVQLPDEYDEIMRGLKPFWGIDEVDLLPIQRDWEAYPDSYTIGKLSTRDPLTLLNSTGTHPRIDQCFTLMKEMMSEVEHLIPPFRAIFSTSDSPNLVFDWNVMNRAVTAANQAVYIDIDDDLIPISDIGWLSGCDPESPARKTPMNMSTSVAPSHNKTFIYDHRASMDPCQHPSHFLQHSQFLRNGSGPPLDYLVPQFSMSTSTVHYDLMPAVPLEWIDGPPEDDDLEWDLKTDERLLWRGSNTGMWSTEASRWRDAQRMRLARLATDGLDEDIDVLRVPADMNDPVGLGVPMKKGQMAETLLDVALVGSPIHCDPDVCKVIEKEYKFVEQQGHAEAGKYKYVIDVDGNGWSSRFKRLMTSKSMVFKSTIYPEWFADRVQPWVHYVPIQIDLSDLADVLVFFRGNGHGQSGHDDLARKIAMAGREWSKRFWRKEDMTAYMFRMFLEYSRVMSLGREGQYYYHNEPPLEIWDGSDH